MRTPTDEEAPRPRHTRAISLRIDEGLLERLQALADKTQRPYQSLLKDYLRDRVEQEERGTLVPQVGCQQSTPTDPLPDDAAAWAKTGGSMGHKHVLTTSVDLIMKGSSGPVSEVLAQGYTTVPDTTYLTLNERLTVEQAIDFLVKLRDRQ
jgi:hypothetical protein